MSCHDRNIQHHATYQDAIHYLYRLQHHGIKLGLKNTRKLLSLLGNPQDSFRSVHIAGTNGKGSTAAFIASILAKAGYRVGLFTSPHLVSFTERIQVNGEKISERDVVDITNHIRTLIRDEADLSPTFFEFVTAIAFLYFRNKEIQWAVVETGMGGRLDATNLLSPQASVITHVAFDHTEFLGNTLREIAREKAGIIKPNIPVVIGSQDPEAEEIIRDEASKSAAPLFLYGRNFTSKIRRSDIHGSGFDYSSSQDMRDLSITLPGFFQVENAAVALKTVELLKDTLIDEVAMRNGLSATRWEGRCELFRWRYPILFDGAHNMNAARSLRRVLEDVYLKEFKDIIFIIGLMGDKDIETFLKTLLPLGRLSIFTTLGFERAAKAEFLLKVAERLGFHALASKGMTDACNCAETQYRKGDLVVITGSFYAVGEAKEAVGIKSSLIGLTEFR